MHDGLTAFKIPNETIVQPFEKNADVVTYYLI